MNKNKKNTLCDICHKPFETSKMLPLMLLRESIWELISKKSPELDRDGYICLEDYKKYKRKSLEESMKKEKGDLSELDVEVIDSLGTQEILSENINESFIEQLTLGERVADRVSSFGGSWLFICIFFAFIIVWMFLNTFILLKDQYDPYPYILLNLILSCLAAFQAPIIMMSQNRRSERDRIQAENDYKVNLKSELQIRHLNMKLDRFMTSQWQQLSDIQQAQLKLMREMHGSLIKDEGKK